MSDTPMTDKAEEKARSEYELMREIDWPPFDCSPFNFARQLERELNAANERIKRFERDIYLQSRQIGRMCEIGDQMAAWLNCERNLGNDTFTAHLWCEAKKPLQ